MINGYGMRGMIIRPSVGAYRIRPACTRLSDDRSPLSGRSGGVCDTPLQIFGPTGRPGCHQSGSYGRIIIRPYHRRPRPSGGKIH